MNFENQTQLTFLDTQQSFKRTNSNIKYVFDLPYDARRDFTNLLDADKSWRELGGRFIGLNETELELYSQATLRNQSPTNSMLSKWEQSNVTIVHLYKCLAVMKHLRAMSILKPFVEPRLHYLCDYNELDTVLTVQNDNSKDNTNAASSSNKPQINLPLQQRDDEILHQQNRKLVADKPKHFNDIQNDLKREVNDNCHLPNQNDKLNHLNVNHPIKPQHYNQPSQTPSQFKSSFSAVASTINAYDDNLPYEEILNATNNFHVSNVIGSGGFGIVYKGFWKGTKVAIKRLKDCGNFSQAITELRVLSQYRIDNIVPLYGISIGGNEPCLIYQFMINGSLDHRLQCKHNSQPLSWNQRVNIGVGIAKALNYLHTRKGRPLIHGDVKSANILLDSQMQPKLGDFGLAKYLQDYQNQHNQPQQSTALNPDCSKSGLRKNVTHVTVSSVHGTVAYLPPEYLRSKILSTAVDVYSYGIVLLEMLTGCRAFDGKSLLLDRVIDELEDAIHKSSKNCALLGEFGNLLNVKQKSAENELTIPSIENNNKYASNCNCLSCKLYKLKDIKLPQNIESLFWFHCIVKLALDCSSKFKKKRPDSATILKNYDTFKDQFKQFTTCNQIFNLTGINTNRNSIASRVSSFKDDAIKTPLEHKLWNDYKLKKNATAPPLPESSLSNEQSNRQQTEQSEHQMNLIDEKLLNLSLSNRLDEVKELLESNSKSKLNGKSSNNEQSNQELEDSFELPLITELGLNIQPIASDLVDVNKKN